jgi:phage-related minor tail protein
VDREARIKLIAEGASQAKKDVNSVGDALKEVGKAAFRAASDAARAMNDVKPIDFGRSAENAKKFDDTVTRLAIRSNRDIGQLSRSFRETGKEIGVLPDRVANVARSLTKLTDKYSAYSNKYSSSTNLYKHTYPKSDNRNC